MFSYNSDPESQVSFCYLVSIISNFEVHDQFKKEVFFNPGIDILQGNFIFQTVAVSGAHLWPVPQTDSGAES